MKNQCKKAFGRQSGNGRRAALLRSLVGSAVFAFAAIANGEPPTPNLDDPLDARLRDRVARPSGLTAEDAARRAVRTSPDDQGHRADVDAANADVERANVGYYPRLTATARYTRLSSVTPPHLGPEQGSIVGTPNGAGPLAAGAPLFAIPTSALTFPVILDQYTLQANAQIPISDYLLRIRQTHASAERALDAARSNRDAARSLVALDAKLAYYAWAGSRLQEAVTEQAVEQAKHHVDLAEAGRDAGRVAEVEVLRAESELSSAELLDERAHNATLLAEERLRTLMHDRASSRYEIGEDLLAPLDATDPGGGDALYRRAVERRAEMRAFEKTQSSLDEQRAATASAGLPRLDGFADAYVANPNPRVFPQQDKWSPGWDIGVQLTWSPNDLGGSNAENHAVDARRRKVDAERAALADAIHDEIAGALLAWKEAKEAAGTAATGLRASEEAYRVRRQLFELGRATNVELVDAESDVLRARLEMVQARVDGRIARVRLDHAVGTDAR